MVTARPSSSPPNHYRFVYDIPHQDRHFQDGHLNAGLAAELLHDARRAYLKGAVAWPGLGPDFWLIYRRLEIDYLSEALDGDRLSCGVRTASRTPRSVHLEQDLWVDGPGRIVVHSLSTEVAFDVRTRRAVEVPSDLWAAMLRYEGEGPTAPLESIESR